MRQVVWCGLECLPELAEMLTPVIETLIIPAQITADNILPPRTECASLFKRGEGVNVFSEDLYMVHTYHQAITTYLGHNKDGLKLTTKIDNLLESRCDIIKILEKEEGIFRQSRSKRSYMVISSLRALLSLVKSFNIIKIEDFKRKETEHFFTQLNEYKLSRHLKI